MKNKSRFVIEVAFTIVVAALLSGVLAMGASMVAGGLGVYSKFSTNITILSSIAFGLILGYRTNNLIREHKK